VLPTCSIFTSWVQINAIAKKRIVELAKANLKNKSNDKSWFAAALESHCSLALLSQSLPSLACGQRATARPNQKQPKLQSLKQLSRLYRQGRSNMTKASVHQLTVQVSKSENLMLRRSFAST
jgi:hypothetical protein